MDAAKFLDLVEARLSALGLSAAAASTQAVGNPYLIRNMQKGVRDGEGATPRMPSFENLQRLCRVLGLEFYVGPPRYDGAKRYDGSLTHNGEPLPTPLSPAIRQALQLEKDATEVDALERIAMWPGSFHEAMQMLADEQNRRLALAHRLNELQQALADQAAEMQQMLAAAIADLREDVSGGFAEAPPRSLSKPASAHAGFAEAEGPKWTPSPTPKRRKALVHDPTDTKNWIGGEPPSGRATSSDDEKD